MKKTAVSDETDWV